MKVIYPCRDGSQTLVENVFGLYPRIYTNTLIEVYDKEIYKTEGKIETRYIDFSEIKTNFSVSELRKAICDLNMCISSGWGGEKDRFVFNENFTLKILSVNDDREWNMSGIEDYGWNNIKGENVEDD